jgi:hypothetical protein
VNNALFMGFVQSPGDLDGTIDGFINFYRTVGDFLLAGRGAFEFGVLGFLDNAHPAAASCPDLPGSTCPPLSLFY